MQEPQQQAEVAKCGKYEYFLNNYCFQLVTIEAAVVYSKSTPPFGAPL